MPILHIQVPPLVTAVSGNPSVHPPADNLHLNGPTVQVTVTVSQDIAAQLTQAGHPVPTPVAGTALIDTGASSTCIDDAIAQQLGLPVIRDRRCADVIGLPCVNAGEHLSASGGDSGVANVIQRTARNGRRVAVERHYPVVRTRPTALLHTPLQWL